MNILLITDARLVAAVRLMWKNDQNFDKETRIGMLTRSPPRVGVGSIIGFLFSLMTQLIMNLYVLELKFFVVCP